MCAVPAVIDEPFGVRKAERRSFFNFYTVRHHLEIEAHEQVLRPPSGVIRRGSIRSSTTWKFVMTRLGPTRKPVPLGSPEGLSIRHTRASTSAICRATRPDSSSVFRLDEVSSARTETGVLVPDTSRVDLGENAELVRKREHDCCRRASRGYCSDKLAPPPHHVSVFDDPILR